MNNRKEVASPETESVSLRVRGKITGGGADLQRPASAPSRKNARKNPLTQTMTPRGG